MERVTIEQAQKIFGSNFVGLEELRPLFERLGFSSDDVKIPVIEFSLSKLQECSADYILILGLSELGNMRLSIRTFRDCFGVDSHISEPCFYNQDWYLHESFIDETLDNRWYLVKKKVLEESRAIQPDKLIQSNLSFPSAILCTYTFFAYYYTQDELLWCYDFVWCNDVDHNGDRVYVGKYRDVDGVNKNGFSIHRHLALRSCYASIKCL